MSDDCPDERAFEQSKCWNRPRPLTAPRPVNPGLHGPSSPHLALAGRFAPCRLDPELKQELAHAAAVGERVILLSHDILAPDACDGTTMAYDYEDGLLPTFLPCAGTVAWVAEANADVWERGTAASAVSCTLRRSGARLLVVSSHLDR